MGDKEHLKTLVAVSIVLAAVCCTGAYGQILYVDAGADPGGDGSSWGTAFKSLQDGLGAVSGHTQILVANGTYKPDAGASQTLRDRTETFQLINEVEIYGGFRPGGTWANRNPNLYVTVLSGDINTPGDSNDNSYHVVTGSGVDSTALLDGFTITAGNADGIGSDGWGGGMYVHDGYPRVSNCRFILNRAEDGGGVCNYDSSTTDSPTLENCIFTSNSAQDNGGGMYIYVSNPILISCQFTNNTADSGGGIYSFSLREYTITNCNFIENSADTFGGAIYNDISRHPAIVKCSFFDNVAGDSGGGIYNDNSDPNIVNCRFIHNSSVNAGGAILNFNNSSSISNCIFTGNTSSGGGGIAGMAATKVTNCTIVGNTATSIGGGVVEQSNINMTNSILWGNSDSFGGEWSQIYVGTSTTEINNNCIQDINSLAGSGNIDADPLFEDANGVDDIMGTADDNLRLSPGSPCIDAGDNTAVPLDSIDLDSDTDKTEPIPLDLDEGPRFVDDSHVTDTGVYAFTGNRIVDMGAYEMDSCGDLGHPYPPGDLNLDCRVDFKDVAVIGLHWLECTALECN